MKTILISKQDSVTTVTLNRPEKRNALNDIMLKELRIAFEELDKDQDTRVIIIEGNGKAFCAGADLAYLKQVSEYSIIENLNDSTQLQQTFHTIYTCSKPVIAKVHGPAIAGGCGLATVCDFIVAGRNNSLFGYSEVKLGFIPAIVSVYLLRKLGDTRTRKLLLSAENINAEEAERIGLITHVVDDETLQKKVNELANQLATNSASSIALTKKMLENLHGMDLDSGLRYAASMNALTRMTEDYKNRIQLFLQQTTGGTKQ